MLCCEYGIPIDNSTIRQQMINPANVCARIIEIFDDYITIQPMGPFKYALKEQLEIDADSIRAVMRYFGRIEYDRMYINKIITFDIIIIQ